MQVIIKAVVISVRLAQSRSLDRLVAIAPVPGVGDGGDSSVCRPLIEAGRVQIIVPVPCLFWRQEAVIGFFIDRRARHQAGAGYKAQGKELELIAVGSDNHGNIVVSSRPIHLGYEVMLGIARGGPAT